MFRCARKSVSRRRVLSSWALAAPAVFGPSARAEVQRYFPQTALRGRIVIGSFPEITLNGQPARLAPGARIRNQNNLLETPAALYGQQLWVHYTTEINGLVLEVWVLRPEELANKPWPTNAEDAQNWSFDPAAQTWTKP